MTPFYYKKNDKAFGNVNGQKGCIECNVICKGFAFTRISQGSRLKGCHCHGRTSSSFILHYVHKY